MALTDNKITVYADNVSDLSDTPNADGLTADQLKAFFDSRGDNEIKESVNGICDDLTATADGASGADQIGATALTGGTATTAQGIMEELDASIKAIPAAEETYTNKTFTNPKINDTVEMVSSSTELNILNGATLSTAELNVLHESVATTGDLNKLASVTSSAAELNKLTGATVTTAEINLLTGKTGTVWTSDNDGPTSGLSAQYSAESTKLSTARSINGVLFDGTASIKFTGICTTAADVAIKDFTITGYNESHGNLIAVCFTNGSNCTSNNISLRINGGNVRQVNINGAYSIPLVLLPNQTYLFYYNVNSSCYNIMGLDAQGNFVRLFDTGNYFTSANVEDALQEIAAFDAAKLPKAGGTMSGALAMGANKITGLANPTENTDAANLQWVQSQLAALHNLDVIGSTSISAVAEDLDANKMPTSSGNAKSITAIETLIGEYVPVEKDSVFVTYLMAGVEEKYQFLYEYSGTAWTVATPTFSVTMANGATAGIVEGASGDAGDIVVTSGIMTLKDASVLTTPLTGYQVAATAADIAATDTINEAFGKAQKQLDVIDTNIGNLTYTEDNYVTDGESVTASIDALDMQSKDTADLVSTNRTSELKSISAIDTTPTDYLAHLFTVTGYAQSQPMPNNCDGKALWSIKGLTATNMVSGESVANGDSVSFSSISGNKYYDTLNNAILTGTGSTMTATNSSGATKSMMIIDLNVLGFQAKTTGELAVIFPYYFDGIRSTLAGMRLFSRGKNLFEPTNIEFGSIALSTGVNAVSTANARTIKSIKATGSTIAIKAPIGYLVVASYFYDKNEAFISSVYTVSNVQTPSLPVNTKKIKVVFSNAGGTTLSTADIVALKNGVQIEPGSTDTPYEPYISSTAYTPQGTLRSVPSASDEVYQGEDGKVCKVQRVSGDYALVAGDITNLVTVNINNDYAVIPNTVFAGITSIVTQINSQMTTGKTIGFDTNTSSDLATNIWTHRQTTTETWIYVPKGTYANLAAAQAALAGTVIRYELATPITTELETIGNLTAYPNGSILAEPCYSGYATGAATIIGTATLPIKGINKVESISLDANGNAVRTDVTASCTVDTTTLTITGYDASKVYFYDLDIDTKYTTTGLKTYQVECPTAVVTHDFAAGATAWTLTANENKANYLKGINAGGAANVVLQPIDGKIRVYQNASGQTQTLKTASSTGVTVLNGKTATFAYMGTDFIKLSEV